MDATRIILAGMWIAVMLISLLGDVLRVFAGHWVPGEMGGQPARGWMWTLAAAIMLLPIAMLLVSLTVAAVPLKWITLVAAIGFAIFNLAGLPYQGMYDNVLIILMVLLLGWIAWTALAWSPQSA